MWGVLVLVVDNPGQLSAKEIGRRLYRPTITGSANVLAVRRAIMEDGSAWTTRVGGMLHRLQQQGLVEGVRPPQVAEDWIAQVSDDPAAAIKLAADSEEEQMLDPKKIRAHRRLRTHLLVSLVRCKPPTIEGWVGTAPTGTVQRAVAELVEWGIVIPPYHRWPTLEGTALVEHSRDPSSRAPKVVPTKHRKKS